MCRSATEAVPKRVTGASRVARLGNGMPSFATSASCTCTPEVRSHYDCFVDTLANSTIQGRVSSEDALRAPVEQASAQPDYSRASAYYPTCSGVHRPVG